MDVPSQSPLWAAFSQAGLCANDLRPLGGYLATSRHFAVRAAAAGGAVPVPLPPSVPATRPNAARCEAKFITPRERAGGRLAVDKPAIGIVVGFREQLRCGVQGTWNGKVRNMAAAACRASELDHAATTTRLRRLEPDTGHPTGSPAFAVIQIRTSSTTARLDDFLVERSPAIQWALA